MKYIQRKVERRKVDELAKGRRRREVLKTPSEVNEETLVMCKNCEGFL